MALAYSHHDPLFAITFVTIADGGSADFEGPLYHVEKRVAFELGEETPYYEYSLRPWFF